MKLVQGDELPSVPMSSHRVGSMHYRRMLDGTDGRPDNFSLVIAEGPGDRYSPRHRHSFEQFRLQLDGTADYSRTGKMTPGLLGYFPEAVPYGPQTQIPGEHVAMLVLQCGGASGNGYVGRNHLKQAIEELKQFGEFRDGVYYRNDRDGPSKKNVDGYQAGWEHINERPLVYPKPRYAVPVLMDPANYAWLPLAGQSGVAQKLLGIFTERRTEIAFYRLDPGATFSAGRGHDIYVVLSGTGTVAGQPLRRFTTVHLDHGERAEFVATEATEIVHFGLPDLRDLFAAPGNQRTAQAAE